MVKCFKGRHEEVEALLQAGADPRAVSSQRFNELFFAAAVSMQHQNIVRLLIQYAGESLVRASAPCFPGLTARHMACLTGNVVIAKLLIDAGGQNLIDQSLDPLNLGSILNTACENAKVEMAALLVKESPGLLRKTTRLGFTALHTASLLGNLAIAKLLVGADKTLLGRTTLEGGPAASWPASTATPASPSFRVSRRPVANPWSARRTRGAAPASRQPYSRAAWRRCECCSVALRPDAGALPPQLQVVPSLRLRGRGNLALVRLLLNEGENAALSAHRPSDGTTRTCLLVACSATTAGPELVQALLEHARLATVEAKITTGAAAGAPCLHMACMGGDRGGVVPLLARRLPRAMLDAQMDNGATPLDVAARCGRRAAYEALRAAGARHNLFDGYS